MSRIRPLLPTSLLFVALLALVTSPAAAITADSGGAPSIPSNGLVDVLCTGGDCARLDLPDMDMDMGFDYVFAGRPTTGGLHLDVSTTGSLFVLGPMNASTITLNAGEVHFPGPGLEGPGVIELPKIDFELPDLTDPTNPIICGCLRISEIGDVTLVAGVTAQEPEPPNPLSWIADFGGDVYLDLSGFEHASITLFAKKKIVVVDEHSLPVPEPGTALLLGFGLAGLAGARRDTR